MGNIYDFTKLDMRSIMFIGVLLWLIILYILSKSTRKTHKLFIFTVIIIQLVYLVWRTVYTIPVSFGIVSFFIGIILLCTEWLVFFHGLIQKILLLKNHKLEKKEFVNKGDLPKVDIIITTFDEPIKILKRTTAACLNIRYPKELINIYLCDDGLREEVKELSNELGVSYIKRFNNRNAKAGNINNALNIIKGDMVLLLDADMVPKNTILEKTIPYFDEKDVGFIQIPREFYGLNPFQYNLGLKSRTEFKHDSFVEEKDNVIFLRKALVSIGGIPKGTIADNVATGMLLQAKGYKSIFIDEVLAKGLATEKFRDLKKQKDRQCRGNIQVFKKWNPLTLKGLSFIQKLTYLEAFIFWFFGIKKMNYIIIPLLYITLGIGVLDASLIQLMQFWVPSFIASLLSYKLLSDKKRTLRWDHVYQVAIAPYLFISALKELLFKSKTKFYVIPKGQKSEKTEFSWKLAIPHIILLMITICGWILVSFNISQSKENGVGLLWVFIVWSIYNSISIVLSILVCFEKPRYRSIERINTNEQVILKIEREETHICNIIDISEEGCRLICRKFHNYNKLNDMEEVEIMIEKIGSIRVKVMWIKDSGNNFTYGVKFTNIDENKLIKLSACY
ncbi:glycosyltransferase [Clostridium sediminicola]|uniref:glycosyltransferase n=1 Tax=Clostridium sediminicola TaxID=3114879 RepID=UPI0031F1FA9A